MTTALTAYTPQTAVEAFKMAETLANSGMFSGSVRNADQAFVIMASGAELGIGPMTALRSIAMVKGKVTLSSELMLRLIIENGIAIEWLESTNEVARLQLTREGSQPFVSTFTQEDAHRAGLHKPGKNGTPSMYMKYPANMLRARAASNGARAYCPDLLTGVYHHGELDDVPRDDVPRDDVPRDVAAMTDVTPPAEPEPTEPHKWTPEEQKRFFAHLKEDNKAWAAAGHAEIEYNDLGDFLESVGKPRPSGMETDKQRGAVLRHLGTDVGRKKYWTWMDAREGLADDADEVPDADFEEVAPEPEAPASLVESWEAIELLIKGGGQAAVDVVGTFEVDLSVEGVRSIRDEHKLEHIKAALDRLAVTDPNESPC